jgi:hypothetical protein
VPIAKGALVDLDLAVPSEYSPEDQAVNVVLHSAKRSTINVNTNQNAGTGTNESPQTIVQSQPDEQRSTVPAWIRGPWGFAVRAAGIVGAATGIAVWVGWNPLRVIVAPRRGEILDDVGGAPRRPSTSCSRAPTGGARSSPRAGHAVTGLA